ncbi:MAG: hypothetical protein CMM01_17880 [Rhodopirellula sp.]|nr:hypothetical protein [Rhodopirellula sp.]
MSLVTTQSKVISRQCSVVIVRKVDPIFSVVMCKMSSSLTMLRQSVTWWFVPSNTVWIGRLIRTLTLISIALGIELGARDLFHGGWKNYGCFSDDAICFVTRTAHP